MLVKGQIVVLDPLIYVFNMFYFVEFAKFTFIKLEIAVFVDHKLINEGTCAPAHTDSADVIADLTSKNRYVYLFQKSMFMRFSRFLKQNMRVFKAE